MHDMTNTSSSRRIHVLVLQGELFSGSHRRDENVPLGGLLRGASALQVTVESATPGQAGQVARKLRPDVILLDGVHADAVDLVTELDEAVGETPVLVVLDEAERDMVQMCVVAGARGCMIRPFDSDTLSATIVQMHHKGVRRRQLLADRVTAPTGGRLIAVRGAKGGVGTTAIASSLAVAIKRRGKEATALVDGHFLGGDVSVALNVAPNRSLVDLLPHLDRLDDDMLYTTMVEHATGVGVLAAPPEFEQAESITAAEYRRVLDAVRARYAYVVVDCSPFLDQNSIAALDMADTILLVTTPEMAALKNAARLIQLASRLDYSDHKLRLLVNRFNMSGAIARSDFEHHLEYCTSFRIPNDDAVGRALGRGEPLATLQASSPAARALDRLAQTIITNEGWEGEPHRGGRGLLRLANWRPFGKGERTTPQSLLEAA
jgi:pilus assembly protein CpaE